MQNRNEETYRRIFNHLKETRPDLDPQSITLDFELASINAIREVFPNIEINGFFFHFCQATFRKLQELGLQIWYQSSANNALLIQTFQALALVSVEKVSEKFDDLVATLNAEDEQRLDDWLDYFPRVWIGAVRRNFRCQPRFALAWWKVHQRVLDGHARTNNSLEGWHRAFDQRVGCTHPTLSKLKDKLKKEQY